MSALYKESLLRATQKREHVTHVSSISSPLENRCVEKLAHAEEFMLITEWLENNIDILKWYSERSNNLSAYNMKTLAHKISIGLKINSTGIIRQMIIYAESFYDAELSIQLNCQTLTALLSILFWIALGCTPEELLHFTYSLYNISDTGSLNFSEFEILVTDLIQYDDISENFQLEFQVRKGNKEIQIDEVCEDFVEYFQHYTNVRNSSNSSRSSSSNDDSYIKQRIETPISSENIPFSAFKKFFETKKRGYLWKFSSLQTQLAEAISPSVIYKKLALRSASSTTLKPLFENGTGLNGLLKLYSEELCYFLIFKYGDKKKHSLYATTPPSLSSSTSSISPLMLTSQRYFQQLVFQSTGYCGNGIPSPVVAAPCPSPPGWGTPMSNGRYVPIRRAVISPASSVPASFDVEPPSTPYTPIYSSPAIAIPPANKPPPKIPEPTLSTSFDDSDLTSSHLRSKPKLIPYALPATTNSYRRTKQTTTAEIPMISLTVPVPVAMSATPPVPVPRPKARNTVYDSPPRPSARVLSYSCQYDNDPNHPGLHGRGKNNFEFFAKNNANSSTRETEQQQRLCTPEFLIALNTSTQITNADNGSQNIKKIRFKSQSHQQQHLPATTITPTAATTAVNQEATATTTTTTTNGMNTMFSGLFDYVLPPMRPAVNNVIENQNNTSPP